MNKNSSRLKKFYKRFCFFIAILVILAALLSSFVRALTPFASQYKRQIELHLSTLLGLPVNIEKMETGWYWFYPVVELKQVKISKNARPFIHLDKILVGLNILDSLWHWQVQPGLLYIEGLNLTIKQSGKTFEVEGLVPSATTTFSFDSNLLQPYLTWIFDQDKIILKNLSVNLILENGTTFPVSGLNLSIAEGLGHYYVKGKAEINLQTRAEVHFLADLLLNFKQLTDVKGNAYLSLKNFDLTPWINFFPDLPLTGIEGRGNAEGWFDFKAGQLKNMQALVDFKKVAWKNKNHKPSPVFQSITANLAWLSTKNGWQLSAEPINLAMDGKIYPKNSARVTYNSKEAIYQIYLAQLNLDFPLLQLPEGFLKALMPKGSLSDLQISSTKSGEFVYILTGFSNLAWKPYQNLPGLENISGVIYWQPKEGRLELDSESAFLRINNHEKVAVEILNGAIEWKDLGSGFKYNLERLVVQLPDLLLTARGNLDKISMNDSQIALSAELSANKVQKWLKYLPSTPYLKPKFEKWLKEDIKQVDSFVAEFSLHGATKDFPFDKAPGEFKIKTYINGVDLAFADKWPLIKNLALWLTIDKRELTADIVHADLLDLKGEKANLVVSDIGSDKEILLLHGQITAPAKDLLAYILATPLRPKLSALDLLDIKDDLDLDLQLEVPLYPEDTEIAGRGDLTFKGNDVTIKHTLNDIKFKNLRGVVRVTEKGLAESQLKAELLNHPVTISMMTVKDPTAMTVIKILGNTSIEALSSLFNLSWLPVMKGNFDLESAFTITEDPNDLDHLHFQTSLQGVEIDLPPPFGKTESSQAPLTVDLGYNPQKGLALTVNYADQLQSSLWFSGSKGTFHFDKGNLILGKEKITKTVKKGFQIVGVLPSFDFTVWQEVFSNLPKSNSSFFSSALNTIAVKIGKANILGQIYANLSISAHKSNHNDWSIRINQKDILADLEYNSHANQLNGSFERLVIQKNPQFSTKLFSKMNAQSLPSMELNIYDLRYNNLNLGNAVIKTDASSNGVKLEQASLQTPFYKLIMTGQWIDTGDKNQTSINAMLTLTNLSKSLERFSLSPVVEAANGTIQLTGGWAGGFQNFSLKNCLGQMVIVLKNGRISQFSPEMEEKLGLGKLLSILSLQTIPRRLQLDFSDLSHKGYSFDIFKGTFDVKKGMMTTKNAYIDGPIAFASMKGSLDIVKQVYNLDLKVLPHIEASLPIVATIAGGPIAGIATWVIGKIIHQGMQKVTGYTYKISGPWKQPLVQQVLIVKRKQ